MIEDSRKKESIYKSLGDNKSKLLVKKNKSI